MKLQFLGIGAFCYPAFRNTSAYFVYKDNLIFLDFGETVFETVMKTLDLKAYLHIYIVLTHLHADHVGSLGTVLSYCNCILHQKPTLVHPQHNVCALLDLLGIVPSFYSYHATFQGLVEGVSIEAVEVQHAGDMRCYGYKIKSENVCLYYSGDASDIPDIVLKDFLSGKIDDIYQDTSTIEGASASHLYYKRLEDLIPIELRKNVHCMHLDCDCREMLKEKGFSIAGE